MPVLPAVCPLCAAVLKVDPDNLPEGLCCECGGLLTPRAHGAAVLLEPGEAPEPPEVLEHLARAKRERKPDRARAHILKALEAGPDSFAANRALLYHGRLYEAVRRPGDFALIKSYLLHMFEEPDRYTAAQKDERMEELFRDPQLKRTAALSGDKAAFLREYLNHLACEYMTIFVRGRSSVSRGIFGFGRSADSVRDQCALIVSAMERNLRAEPRLAEDQRELLIEALKHGLAALA